MVIGDVIIPYMGLKLTYNWYRDVTVPEPPAVWHNNANSWIQGLHG
jgi:hypothetical protein